jgi:carbon monoxide dehydrogenase subunit G
MELKNQYEIGAPVDTLWDVLNDVERIAPFVPGFALAEVDGDTYRGTIKIKVGAITVSYNAEIEVLERDEAAKRVVMEVSGRERRGPGSVHAKVTSLLHPRDERTQIALVTEVQVTGKVAQFGSGVLSDVSASLLGQFVKGLEEELQPSGAAPAAGANGAAAANGTTVTGAAPAPERRAPDVLDIGSVAGPALAKRALPALVAGLLMGVVGYVVGRRQG